VPVLALPPRAARQSETAKTVSVREVSPPRGGQTALWPQRTRRLVTRAKKERSHRGTLVPL